MPDKHLKPASDHSIPEQDDQLITVRVNPPAPRPAPVVAHPAGAIQSPPISADTPGAPELPGSIPRESVIRADRSRPQLVHSRPLASVVPVSRTPERAEASGLESDTGLKLDDPTVDAAIDDIVARESDALLAAEDTIASESFVDRSAKADPSRLQQLVRNRKFWVLCIAALVVVFSLPFVRYPVLGLIISKPAQIRLIDSQTGTPISRATISDRGIAAITNADGIATLRLPVGKQQLLVSKQYYARGKTSVFVGLGSTQPAVFKLVATGCQVPVRITNQITGAPVADAVITAHGTTAKTTVQGLATIVVPPNAPSLSATIDRPGYNGLSVHLQINPETNSANDFSLTPSGQVYYLVDHAGSINVDKANLDGSSEQTVLAGSGQEDPATTSLLASSDWKYLVLKADRDSGRPALYLISASSGDQLTEFDNSDATFTPIGWIGDNFIYDEIEQSVPTSSPSHELIKSYDAATGQLNQIDQNQENGTGDSYSYQTFNNFKLVSGALVYTTQWLVSGSGSLDNFSDSIRTVQPLGQNKKDYLTVPATGVSTIQATQVAPATAYYAFSNQTANTITYYQLQNNVVSQTSSLNEATFNASYPTYYPSPSAAQTLWKDTMTGSQDMLIGDQNGQNAKATGSLPGYQAFGWYGNNYLLLSKNNDQLYITGTGSGSQTPQEITSYERLPSGSSSTAYVRF